MTREDFRRELGDAFDSISGPPSPALSDRVRSALVEAPERRGPVWIAALAAAVIAVILVGVLSHHQPAEPPAGVRRERDQHPERFTQPDREPKPDRVAGVQLHRVLGVHHATDDAAAGVDRCRPHRYAHRV